MTPSNFAILLHSRLICSVQLSLSSTRTPRNFVELTGLISGGQMAQEEGYLFCAWEHFTVSCFFPPGSSLQLDHCPEVVECCTTAPPLTPGSCPCFDTSWSNSFTPHPPDPFPSPTRWVPCRWLSLSKRALAKGPASRELQPGESHSDDYLCPREPWPRDQQAENYNIQYKYKSTTQLHI